MKEQTFVARESEIAHLDHLLNLSVHGKGQICFITGEAGFGKTALLTSFASRAIRQYPDLVVALGTCSSRMGISDPFLPFRDILSMLTGDVTGELGARLPSSENETRLKDFLRISGQAIVELGPDLLDILIPGSGIITRAGAFLAEKVGWLHKLEILEKQRKASPSVPQRDPSRMVEQYIDVINALSDKRPLIIGIDDLQWADPSSLDLLFQLGRKTEYGRVLLIGTFRPEEIGIGRDDAVNPFVTMFGDLKRYRGNVELSLEQSQEESREFVWALIDTEPNRLDEDFREDLLHHTSGHALFTVEVLKEMQDRGDLYVDEDGFWCQRSGFAWDNLPSRVEGVIETRIKRLPAEDQQILQTASVEGETFTGEVLAEVHKFDPSELIRRLSREFANQHQLITAEGMQHLGSQRISRYRFKHLIFQEFLYAALDDAERSYLHEDIGTAIEELYGDRAQEVAVQLSHHFTLSGNQEKAVHYLLLAGNQAHAASAYRESIATYRQGLKLVEGISEGPGRTLKELMLYLSLGNALMVAKGAADKEVEEVFRRAFELSREVEDSAESFIAIRGLALHDKMRGEFDTSKAIESQLLDMAKNLQDPILLTEAHRLIAESFAYVGAFVMGQEHYHQAARNYNPVLHTKFSEMLGMDSGVIAQSQSAYFTWLLGYPDRAVVLGHEALVLARELGHPFSLAIALDTLSALYHQLRDPLTCRDLSQESSDLSEEFGFPFWNARACMRRGWALAMLDQIEEGIALIDKGLEILSATGSNISMPCMWVLFAEAQLLAGDFDKCYSATEKAVSAIEDSNERYCEVEVHRIRADCLCGQGNHAEAEEEYRHAIQVALSQNAKSLELRSRLQLTKLLLDKNERKTETSHLEKTYGWFKEGFDTPDLMEVKTLLG